MKNRKEMIAEKILDASENRMVKFGYRKVTMDEIAQDLAMSKNTIYLYFRSKVDIAKALFDRLKKRINERQGRIEKENKDPLDVISKNILFFQKELSPWFDHFLKDIKLELPDVWRDFTDYRKDKIFEIKDLIEKGIKKGVFRKINSSLAVRVYLGAVESIINPDILEEEQISFQEALDTVLNIWSFGILEKRNRRAA
ncbi:MAG TPA: TetR/AcrR family transcriptional regulator [Candidatus Omnitrophota bacterium]|nr:TetR/AcrR family transcriptional regulator [Candidatus Omnitrophota bacterium]